MRNEIELLNEIIKIAQESHYDAKKVAKNNKTAGIRLRKAMQIIKKLTQEIRDNVQERKELNGKKEIRK